MKITDLITKHSVVPEGYEPQINRYTIWCELNTQAEGVLSLIEYLLHSLAVEGVKKSTWELRLQSVKSYLAIVYGVDAGLSQAFQDAIKAMRSEYKTFERKSQMLINGAPLVDKEIILERIMKLPGRAKAITLVNLDTVNRPSEMVRMKVQDFDLGNNAVNVYLKKEKRHHVKNLNPRTVQAVKEYIDFYKLKPSDYFVGKFNYRKSGLYESSQISEVAYAKSLKTWVGVTASTIRKSQITAMHEAGADLATIKKQTGLWCEKTLVDRHLKVSDQTVSKYI